jgi:hypothetical protein
MYPLTLNSEHKGCLNSFSKAFRFDTRYNFVGKVDEETLFKDNDIDKIIETLPNYHEYSDPKDYEYNLYARHYVPWDRNNFQCSYDGSIYLVQEAEAYTEYITSSYFLLYIMALSG